MRLCQGLKKNQQTKPAYISGPLHLLVKFFKRQMSFLVYILLTQHLD